RTLTDGPMGDARCSARTGPYALAGIASVTVGTTPVIKWIFAAVAPLQSAWQDEGSALNNRRMATALELSAAGGAIVQSTNAGTPYQQHHRRRSSHGGSAKAAKSVREQA